MMKEARLAERIDAGSAEILFVGSQFFFPDLILRLVRSEFDVEGTLRRDDLDDGGPELAPATLRLIVLEEGFASGLAERFQQLRGRFPNVPIALAYQNRELASRLLQQAQTDRRLQGLHFLPINAPIGKLVSMLQILLMGECVVPGELLGVPGTAGHGIPSAPGASAGGRSPADELLTPREQQVLELVAQGARNKSIAGRLGLSEHTVKLHIHNIISKIGVENRTEAANWFLAQTHAGGVEQAAE